MVAAKTEVLCTLFSKSQGRSGRIEYAKGLYPIYDIFCYFGLFFYIFGDVCIFLLYRKRWRGFALLPVNVGEEWGAKGWRAKR